MKTQVNVGTVALRSFVLTAAGTAGYGKELSGYGDLATLGAVVTKSLAAFAWEGNPAPRVAASGLDMLNAVGLAGPGVAAWRDEYLPEVRATGADVVGSIWGRTTGEYADAALAMRGADVVAVVWTSGTTGLPKGALFSHDSLRSVAEGTDVLSQPGDRRLSPLPFSHVSYVTRAWDEIAHGVTTIISPSPWQARSSLEVMRNEAVTVAQGVPTQWALMLELDELDASNLPSLRVAGTGAARMAPSQVAEIRRRLGVPVIVRYTSTETSLGTGTRPGDDD